MVQTFSFALHWKGSTSTSSYSRNGVVQGEHKPDIMVSAAAPLGDDDHWNPEEMLGAAVANCQMLTFLALAAKAGLNVQAYDDRAEVVMDMKDGKTRVTRVKLSPVIRFQGTFDNAKAHELYEKAHKYCIISNSVTSEVILEPSFAAV